MYVRTYTCIQLASSAWNVSHDSVYMYTLETRRYPRETVDFIKLTGDTLAFRWNVEKEKREKKKTRENSFSSLGFSPFSWEIVDKVYARFYEPADFVTTLFQSL